MIWKYPEEWIGAFLVILLVIAKLWAHIEVSMYGYTQESVCDFIAAVIISKRTADYIIRRMCEWL